MLDNWLSKSKLKKWVENFTKRHLLGKISPNQITIMGLVIGLISAFTIFLSGTLPWMIELMIVSSIMMVISFIMDAFDGALARLNEPTILGGVLDMFCDRTVEVSIIIALISTDPIQLTWPGIFSLASMVLCITMFLVVGGAIKAEELKEAQKVIYYRKGLMERSETFLILLFINILFFWRNWLLWIFASLVFLTALLRLRDASNLFRSINDTDDKKRSAKKE